MATYKITPRFNDTDALGHINHSVVLMWLEESRRFVFELFNPTLEIQKWNLIVARVEIDYKAQISYHHEAEVRTEVNRLGNSSFSLKQKIFQNNKICSEAIVTMVHFDYEKQKAAPLTEEQRNNLMNI